MTTRQNVAIYLFDNMTMLDGYAPLQILSLVEQFNCFTFGTKSEPMPCDSGVMLLPQHDLDSCPALDIIVMPGGGNVLPPMTDLALLEFLRHHGPRASYVTSVCSGAMILAEAGLLDGFRATTHWAWKEDLAEHYPNVEVVDERVCIDRDRITGGGVTAGIDFALSLIAEVVDPMQAQALQLLVEYRPEPPFNAGSPATAPAPIAAAVRERCAEVMAPMRQYLERRAG